ncbi:oxygenase MpaB family protein [Streptomyces sp. P9-2B-1]|uniref:oxygenase MpaB family protein n=1 Tax=Streptomyces sp. P9-2B-1 TaxID=3057115 RepID=UPI0025B589A5|nr:oxygenase MpaB family protein [Streptomyces sp. P9-2B-1]WJY35459.1 oxygenase MpaB family protein [Streptomyces sp. P9-2B-1]
MVHGSRSARVVIRAGLLASRSRHPIEGIFAGRRPDGGVVIEDRAMSDHMSRRHVLGAAAAAGAVALLATNEASASPRAVAAAQRPGTAVDPKEKEYLEQLTLLADPVCDEAVADLFQRGQGAAVNEAMRGWSANSQPVPDGLPAKLRDFLESARRLPSWADPAALARGQRFVLAHAQQISFSAVLDVTPVRMKYPAEAEAIFGIEGPHDNKQGFAKALRGVGDTLVKDPYGPTGSVFVTMARIRVAHSAVRHLLWTEGNWDPAKWGAPLSQLDMLAEWNLFSSYLADHLYKLGVHLTEQEATDYLYVWRVFGALLGMPDDSMPETVGAARTRAAAVDALYARVTPRSATYVKATIEYFASLAGPKEATVPPATALVRYMIGETDADAFGLARSSWDAVVPLAVKGFFTGTQAGGLPTPSATMTRIATEMVSRAMNDGKKADLTMPLHLYGHQ